MNFKEMLLEVLLEGKLEDTLDRHPTIPDDVKQNYLKQIPAQNAQHLDWVLSQHTKGNINSSHDIGGLLNTFNKVKDRLPKKQIHQYSSIDELHSAVIPKQDNVKRSDNEKSKEGTETLYTSPTMTIRQHHNYESCVGAANLSESNPHEGKAKWCVSVGNGGGAGHYSKYTSNGFNPVYTIEHKHEDGTSSRHMLVYDHTKEQGEQELRNEFDHRPGFKDNSSTRPDLLDHYGTEHPELHKTPIAKLFSEAGREQYKKEAGPAHKKLQEILSNIPYTGMSDEEYMSNFKEGLKKQQGGIHNELAKVDLSPTQLTHLIEHGNAGCMHQVARRMDLSDEHMQKLANTNNMLVHHNLLQKSNLPIDTFNTIVKKAHPENVPDIISYSKFNETHLDAVLNKKISNVALSPILRKFHDKLEPHHISALIDKGDSNLHYNLIDKIPKKLDTDHISALIDKGDLFTHNALLNTISGKLDTDHISALIDKGDSNIHTHIISSVHTKLEPHHISALIDKNDQYIYDSLASTAYRKLDTDHISALIDKGNSTAHHSLINKAYYKLEPHHISALIDKGDSYSNNSLIHNIHYDLDTNHITSIIGNDDDYVNRTLVDTIPSKLEPHHIKQLIDNGHSSIINHVYPKLSPESKNVVDAHVKSLKNNNDTGLNEWNFSNNNFERLLKESLLT